MKLMLGLMCVAAVSVLSAAGDDYAKLHGLQRTLRLPRLSYYQDIRGEIWAWDAMQSGMRTTLMHAARQHPEDKDLAARDAAYQSESCPCWYTLDSEDHCASL